MAVSSCKLSLAILGSLLSISHTSPDSQHQHHAQPRCQLYVTSNGWTWCAADGRTSFRVPLDRGVSPVHASSWSSGVYTRPTDISQLPGFHLRGASDPKPKTQPTCHKTFVSKRIFMSDQKGIGKSWYLISISNIARWFARAREVWRAGQCWSSDRHDRLRSHKPSEASHSETLERCFEGLHYPRERLFWGESEAPFCRREQKDKRLGHPQSSSHHPSARRQEVKGEAWYWRGQRSLWRGRMKYVKNKKVAPLSSSSRELQMKYVVGRKWSARTLWAFEGWTGSVTIWWTRRRPIGARRPLPWEGWPPLPMMMDTTHQERFSCFVHSCGHFLSQVNITPRNVSDAMHKMMGVKPRLNRQILNSHKTRI